METKIIIENQLNDYLNAQVNEDLQANRFFEITSLKQEIIIIKDQIYTEAIKLLNFQLESNPRSRAALQLPYRKKRSCRGL